MPAKKTTKKSAPPASPVARKKPGAKRAEPANPSQGARARPPRQVSAADPDALARAAYLVYRHRVEHGLPGDAESDWLEAEQQLGLRS